MINDGCRLALVLTSLLVLAACGETEAAPQKVEASPAPVELERVSRKIVPSTLLRTATLASRRDFALVVESSGVVERRVAAEGARLAGGALVLSLDDAAEAAAVAAQETQLEDLVISGAALAERHRATASLEAAREALRRRHVHAPAEAVLDRYLVDPGEWVAAGTPVARFIDPVRLYCIATVIEADVLRIDRASPVSVDVAAFPDTQFTGRIVRVGSGGQAGSGRFEVEMDLDPDPRLRAGFVVTLGLPLEGEQARLTVSREAVFTRYGTERVFVAAEETGGLVARERSLRTRALPGDPGRLEVLEGLDDGERVVVRGRIGLAAGQALEPREQ